MKNVLGLSDICQELGIGKTTAYKLLKDNKIPSGRIGKKKKIIVLRQDLDAYVASLIDRNETKNT